MSLGLTDLLARVLYNDFYACTLSSTCIWECSQTVMLARADRSIPLTLAARRTLPDNIASECYFRSNSFGE